MAVVLLAERAVEIEAGAAVAGHPAKLGAVADVARLGVASVMVGTVRIARVPRWRMAAEAVEIVPAEALPWPSAAAAVPSFSRRPTAPARSVRASAATAAAYPVVEEDAPWTSVAEEAEECSPGGSHRTAAAARAAEADDPSVVQESTAAAAAARPFRDASRDAEDDETGGRSRSSSVSAAAPAEARPRTADEVCPLGLADSERLRVFPRRYRASRPWRRV